MKVSTRVGGSCGRWAVPCTDMSSVKTGHSWSERLGQAAPRAGTVPWVTEAWVRARMEQLGDVLAGDPVRAREEIAKHLHGDPLITPLPPDATAKTRAAISGFV